jgi:hypothetical protein
VIRCLPVLLACLLPLHAQSWDALHGLKPGEPVRIVDNSGQERRGSFSTLSPESLTVQTGAGMQSIQRTSIRQIKVRSSSRRIRNLLIGVGIGVATGVAVDQTLGAALRNETGDSKRPLMYLAPIGLFGAIGGAFPAYRTVYRAR